MLTYVTSIATFASIYALLALGLNLMWGTAGMVNLGILGYYALGAYTTAILTVHLGYPLYVGVVAGIAIAWLFGVATSVGIVRLVDDYLAIVTLGFAEMMRVIAENALPLTNGTDGIGRIPRPGWPLAGQASDFAYLGLCILMVIVVGIALDRVRRSPYGRVLRAIREDPMVAATAGKHVFRFQLVVLAVAGAIMGLAGVLYAHYVTYVSPEIFEPQLLIYVFFALIVGGKGNYLGAVAGTFLVVFFVEGTRFLAEAIPLLSAVQVGALRAIIIGVGFIIVLQRRPRGLFPEPLPRYADPGRPAAGDAPAPITSADRQRAMLAVATARDGTVSQATTPPLKTQSVDN